MRHSKGYLGLQIGSLGNVSLVPDAPCSSLHLPCRSAPYHAGSPMPIFFQNLRSIEAQASGV